MEKILFPTDFSTLAGNALQYAIKLAKELDGQIDLYHIYNLPYNDTASVPYTYIQQLQEEKEKWIQKQFEDLKNRIPAEILGSAEASFGLFPALEITDLVQKRAYDYIVMGTKGSRNCLDRLMGSITSRVILRADCPVIAIPEGAVYKPITNIAYATSFEPSAKYSLQKLMSFTSKIGAKIQLVHVNSKSNEGILQHALKTNDLSYPYTHFTVINNYSVTKGLETFAHQFGLNMLALFVPNRRLLERIFHKSVSKNLALHSKVPLIVFSE